MKITDKIANYASMTPEERLAAIEALDFDDSAEELNRAKQAVTNANREAAELKKKLNEANERATAGSSDLEKQLAAITKELENERRARRVANYTAQFVSQGFDAKLAESTASLIGGLSEEDAKSYFDNTKAFLDAHDKAYKAELLKQTPRPKVGGTGDPGTAMTKNEIMSIKDAVARQEAIAAHADLFL